MFNPGENDLREALDLIDVESYLDMHGIKYRKTTGRSGPQFLLKDCPVCHSNGWKVYLSRDTGLGNCFGGSHPPGQNFNKWSFIRAHHDSNGEAVAEIKRLAAEFGWRPKARKVDAETAEPMVWSLPNHCKLPDRGWMPDYLTERGITPELAYEFDIRYCEKGWFVYKDEEGKERFQAYDQRILIPVTDMAGNIENFQGRDTTGTAERKYLFPPGLRGTGTLLYNGFRAKGAGVVVICEGAFDVWKAQAAFRSDPKTAHISVIGTFGIAVGMGAESQLDALRQLRDEGAAEFVFMWDGEPKAIDRALHYGLEMTRRNFPNVKVALLPDGKDPGELPAKKIVEAYWRSRKVTPDSAMELRLRLGI